MFSIFTDVYSEWIWIGVTLASKWVIFRFLIICSVIPSHSSMILFYMQWSITSYLSDLSRVFKWYWWVYRLFIYYFIVCDFVINSIILYYSVDSDEDEIIECDGCGILVHEGCYGTIEDDSRSVRCGKCFIKDVALNLQDYFSPESLKSYA